MKKKEIIQSILVFLIVLFGLLSWISIDKAIRIAGSSTWLVPIVYSSFFVIFLCLGSVLLCEKRSMLLALLISFSFSLFFAFNPWHVLILLLSIVLANWGLGNIHNDLGLNIEISLWKSLLTGKTQIVWALALLVSSQYYFTISSIDGQKNMPELNINESIVKYVIPVLGFVNPSFKDMDKDGLTVNQYLLNAQGDVIINGSSGSINVDFIDSQIPASIPAGQREILKQDAIKKMLDAQNKISQKNKDLLLTEARKQFSKSIQRDLNGDEKMSEVLAGIVGQKMNSILQSPLKGGETIASMIPLIFSVVLFFTILPLSSWFLSGVWFVCVIMIFSMLIKIGFIKIGKEMTEKENIQY